MDPVEPRFVAVLNVVERDPAVIRAQTAYRAALDMLKALNLVPWEALNILDEAHGAAVVAYALAGDAARAVAP